MLGWQRCTLIITLLLGCLANFLPTSLAATSHPYRQHAPTLHQQAQALLQQGRVIEAVNRLQLAISYNPYSAYTATLYNTLGLAYLKANYPQLAVVSFMYASRLQPHYAPYYDNMVKVWQATQSLAVAQGQLETLTLRSPQDGQAWYLLGVVYGAQQQWQMQQQAWRQFLAYEPNSPLRPSVCQVVPNCRSINAGALL
jgi:tetratricopeptide (TPR) repeat protein